MPRKSARALFISSTVKTLGGGFPSQLCLKAGPFLEQAIRSDGASAVRMVLSLLDQGVPTEAVVVDLLAAAQHECGERWLKNEWTVADEHVVSAVTQRALDAIASSVTHARPTGSVVVACAEGDWHSLPAQMFTEVQMSQGFLVSFLGASSPSDQVARRLMNRERPDALVVTCNLALYFTGVASIAEAAHSTGVPVIADGRALKPGPSRALRLGADAWAPDIPAAVTTLREWADERPSPRPNPTMLDRVAMGLDLESPLMADAAFDSMIASYPWMGWLVGTKLARTKEDLTFIVRFVAAARLIDDPSVLMEFLDWLDSLLVARGVPMNALVAGLEALAPHLDYADAKAGQLIQDALRHLSEGHAGSIARS